MTIRQPSTDGGPIRWERNQTPQKAVAEWVADMPIEVLGAYVKYVKAEAGGRFRIGQRPKNWPVKTGYSRRRFRRTPRRKGRDAPRVLKVIGARYAPYVDANGKGILRRVWKRFGTTQQFADANEAAARRASLRGF